MDKETAFVGTLDGWNAPFISIIIGQSLRGWSSIAKFVASSSVGMLAIAGDGEGVDVGTEDGPRA